MTRLDLLKKELEVVKGLKCMYLGTKELAVEQYVREITAIEKYGAPNREIENVSDNPYQE